MRRCRCWNGGWTCSHADSRFALQAANVLDRLGEAARPSLPAMQRVLATLANENGGADPRQYLRRSLQRTTAVLEGRETPLVYPAIGSNN